MDESLLKKRIDDLDWWSGCVLEDIHKILDEARKDFPEIRNRMLFESDDNWKVLNWRDKWFGEDKDE